METTKRGRKVALLLGLSFAVLLAALALSNWKELRTRYLLWREFERLGNNAQGYGEYRHRRTGIVFVRVPGGTFRMGSPETEPVRLVDEGPVHTVTLSPFLIAKYEVTQAEWQRVMGENPSHFKGDRLPVEQVSWEDCNRFCTRAGLTLPTESQWEYACRAGTEGPFAGTGKLDDMGWYKENRGNTTHTVAQKEPNAFGLYDMHGNVYEWCEDVYDGEFYSSPEAVHPNPVASSDSESRVMRGGTWRSNARNCRSACRNRSRPTHRDVLTGFRPSRPLP